MTPQNLIHDVLPEAVMQAFGWTLLHSLWQGTLIALLVAALLGLMHRHTAATRYLVALGGLVVLLLLSVFTFYKLYQPAGASMAAPVMAPTEVYLLVSLQETSSQPVTSWEATWGKGQAYLNQHLPAVVALWLLGMLLMGLRVVGGWVYVQRLRSYRTRAVPEIWHQKIRELSQKLGMNQLVRLTESTLVQVPLVIGHMKPLILLPVGTLAGLSAAQVEAILAHELVHVYRRDYLLNLLQSIAETLFFFHPAVWWISDCVRTEREHACDDLAVALCGDSLSYVRALTNLAELKVPKDAATPGLAVAFSGRRRSLLNRITRLVQRSTARPSFSEGFLANFAVMAGVLVFAASAWANNPAPEKPAPPAKTGNKEAVIKLNPIPDKPKAAPDETEKSVTLQQPDDDLVIVQNKKGKVVEVYVNGKRLPKQELSKYQDRIEQQLAAVKKAKTIRGEAEIASINEQVEASLEKLEEDTNHLFPRDRISSRKPEHFRTPNIIRFREMDTIPPLPLIPPLAPLGDDKESLEQYKKSLQEYEAQLKQYETRMKEFGVRQRVLTDRMEVNRENRLRDHARLMEAHKHRITEQAGRFKEQEKRLAEHGKRMEEHRERLKKHEAMMQALKTALLADGLIKSADAQYEFKLDKTGLYVDGKKQPDALFEKYKKMVQETTGEDMELLLKKDGAGIHINSKHGTSTTK